MPALVALTITVPGTGFDIPSNVVILGTITGLTYALIAVGITLVYRTSRVLNFAAGEMGALPAVLIPILVINNSWPYWLALTLSLLGALVLSVGTEAFVIRPLSRGPRLTMLVATIGLAQVFFGLNLLIPRGGELTGKSFPVPFDWRVTIGTLVLGPGQILILIVAPICIVALTWYLNHSPLGRASRAAAENSDAALLAGVPTGRVSMTIWGIAGLLAGVGAILAGGTRPLTLSMALGPALLLRALGASMIGGLRSIWGSFAGGIGIGIVEALIIWNYPVGGVLEVVLAALIMVSMLVRPGLGRQPRGADSSGWSLTATIRPLVPAIAHETRVRVARWLTMLAFVAAVVVVPLFVRPSNQIVLTDIVLTTMMCLSLVVLTGYAGHVSLGQFAFVGIGAAAGGRLYQLGLPHLPAAVLVTVLGAVLAAIVGLPALRMRGLFLSVATLGLALATSSWLLYQSWFVHVDPEKGSSMQLPRPHFLGIDFNDERYYYWLCLGVALVTGWIVYRIRHTSLGRAMIAVRENELSAASMAQSPRRVKLSAFALSGAIASLAGFMYGGLLINFSSNPGDRFGPGESLSLVVTAVFGGIASVTGAVLGSLWIVGIPRLLGKDYALFSSGFAVVAVLLMLPGGLATVVFRLRDRVVDWLLRDRSAATAVVPTRPAVARVEPRAPLEVAPASVAASIGPAPIEAANVSVRFGGLMALDCVSISARKGEILGLMGPNGAGKTTLFDVLGGNIRAEAGRVQYGGRDITDMSPHKRARIGLGRTYQQARLYGELTTAESVAISLQHHRAWWVPNVGSVPMSARTERRLRGEACEILDRLEIGDYADRPVAQLPTGIRRVAELACVIALEPDVLLLDEPTAGFTPRETTSFLAVVHEVRDYLDATIVMIDHDIHVMRDLVGRLYVLAAGQVIAEGPPSVLETDAAVRDVYTGAA